MKIFENGDYILFDENVICFVISVIDISCQFSCERIEDLRFNTSDTGYVGVSRQLQTNRRFTQERMRRIAKTLEKMVVIFSTATFL